MPEILGLALIAIGILMYLLRIPDWLMTRFKEPMLAFYSLFFDHEQLEVRFQEGVPVIRMTMPAVPLFVGIVLVISSL